MIRAYSQMLMSERQCFTKTNETHLFQTQYLSRRVGGRVSPRFVSSFGAMGDRPQGPPRLQWDAYSTAALLETIGHILAVLVARNQELPTGESVLPGTSSASSSSRKGACKALIGPWTCGYRCRFCEQACARRSQLLELPPQKTMRQQLGKEPC